MVCLCNHQQSTIQINLAYHRHRRRKLVKLCLLTIWKSQHFKSTQTPNGIWNSWSKFQATCSFSMVYILILLESLLIKRDAICCTHMYGHEWPRKLVWQARQKGISDVSLLQNWDLSHLLRILSLIWVWYLILTNLILGNLAKLVFPKEELIVSSLTIKWSWQSTFFVWK